MSGAISIGTMAMVGAGVVGGMAMTGAFSKPKMPAIQTPEKPPQDSKAPDRRAAATANAASAMPGGAMAGNSGTFLTGPEGVDPMKLNLGKNTLLGE